MLKKSNRFTAAVLSAALVGISLLPGCTASVKDDLRDLYDRVTTLEEATSSLEQMLGSGMLIQSIDPLSDNSGYRITFAGESSREGEPQTIDILHGDHGVTPKIEVRTNANGTVSIWQNTTAGYPASGWVDSGIDLSGPQGDPGASAVTPRIKVEEVDGKLTILYNVSPGYPASGWVNTGVDLKAPASANPLLYIVDNDNGTVTFGMNDTLTPHAEYTFMKSSTATGFEILTTQKVVIAETVTGRIVFRVNPSAAWIPLGTGAAIEKWALDQLGTRSSYVNPSSSFSLVSILRDGTKTGQYVATITCTAYDPAIEDYVMALVLNNNTGDDADEDSLVSSAPFVLGAGPEPIWVADIALPGADTLLLGESVTLVPVFDPIDATYQELLWESDAPSIASVDETGKVKGLAFGETTITVTATNGTPETDDDVVKTCVVSVQPGLTLSNDGHGQLRISIDGVAVTPLPGNPPYPVPIGATVTLDTLPSTGYRFDQWDATGVTVDSDNEFVMPAGNANVKALFKAIPFPLTLTFTSAQGTVTAKDGDDQVITTATIAQTVSFTATPASGYLFDHWEFKAGGNSKNLEDFSSHTGTATSPSISFWMPGTDLEVIAVFVADNTGYAITPAPATNGTLTVDLTGTAGGNTVTLTAAPAAGYYLKSYTVTGNASSDPVTVTFDTATGNVTDKATFTMPFEAVTAAAEFAAYNLNDTPGQTATINGVAWMTTNADAGSGDGLAAAPTDAGLFYEFGKTVAWSVTGTAESTPVGESWPTSFSAFADWDMTANNPCPAGYVVPTQAQAEKLIARDQVAFMLATTGTPGAYFVDRSTGEAIFLPAAGQRTDAGPTNSTLAMPNAFYWMANKHPELNDYISELNFTDTEARITNATNQLRANSVRCVAE